jgi:MFS family permease
MKPKSKKALTILIYLASFLYSFHYALPVYINSSFIGGFLPTEAAIGLLFALSAVFSTVITYFTPHILRRYGNYRATLFSMLAIIVSVVGLSASTNPLWVILFFIAYQVLIGVIFIFLDVFVESFTEYSHAGGIRAMFMTVLNVAVAIAPLMAGLMLTDHNYWTVYLVSAVVMLFGAIIIGLNFKDYVDPPYTVSSLKETWAIIRKNRDIYSIIYLHFLLAFFYAWMVVYTPIYLNLHMGIPMYAILGIIIPISLSPFIILEVILGKIADARLGEKEIMTAGFIVLALSTGALSYITSSSVALWAGALLLTRIGASAVEAMTESYFYKHVQPREVHIITFMRTVRSSAYIFGPLIGSLALLFISDRYIFLVLGIAMLTAIPYCLVINDTK